MRVCIQLSLVISLLIPSEAFTQAIKKIPHAGSNKMINSNPVMFFGFEVGPGFMPIKTEGISSDFHPYLKQLQSGFIFAAEGSHSVGRDLALGLRFSRFTTSNTLDGIYIRYQDGTTRTGSMSDDITISTFGPVLTYQRYNRLSTSAFILSFGLAYNSFNNAARVIDPLIIKGETVGLNLKAGMQVKLTDEFVIAFNGGFNGNSYTKLTYVENGKETVYTAPEGESFVYSYLFLDAGLTWMIFK